MAVITEVEAAVEELRLAYPDATVTAVPDDDGGVYVTIDPVDLGPKYVPRQTWIKFHVTFQYPLSDVYPHFIRPDVRRADGTTPTDGTPLGTGSSNGSVGWPGQDPLPAIQLSRKSNRLNPATDTAALKLEKVLVWLASL